MSTPSAVPAVPAVPHPLPDVVSAVAPPGSSLGPDYVRAIVASACPPTEYRGRRALLIVPDGTRTAPVDWFFQALHDQLAPEAAAFDVMVALGTHPPMSEQAI